MGLVLVIVGASLGLMAAMALAWTIQRRTGNAGWVDVVWTFATGAVGVGYAAYAYVALAPGPRPLIVGALVGVWALRLGSHLAARTAKAAREDARYAEFRREWGAAFESRLFLFLQAQALSSALLALSILAAAANPAPGLTLFDALGAAILAAAILGEGAADSQLAHYKADPAHKGGICGVGLWGWSRHPNYFFEWLGWLAYPVIAIGPTLGAWPWGWSALSGAAFMFLLLRFVSGVPPTEAAMARSRGAAFDAYRARVGAFFPRPPRRAPPLVPSGEPR